MGFEDELVYKAATYFSAGIASTGAFCGALTGGIMVLGIKYGRANPRGGSASESSGTALKLFKWFEREYGTTCCSELTGFPDMLDLTQKPKFHASEAHRRCFRRSGEVAAKVVELISEQGSRPLSLREAIAELKGQGLL